MNPYFFNFFYFNVNLKPEGDICLQEYEGVKYISDLIQNEEVHTTWTESTFTGIIDQRFRQRFLGMNDELGMFSYVGISQVKLFRAEFNVRFLRTYLSARIVDFDKIQKKLELMDDGESIKIQLQPGDDNTAVETLRIPKAIIDE